ncbi:hypothetical protein [Streptomyces sp. TRM70350]|uniref:hypothetical protein n=1 Tax=Streptomyces sp. TRM70350 TaxID=2856165 RepID=UPI001C486A18|nr:hypothetical protein [Streptomyces sp. TRM70350]MBV7699512.1 hypothetical protein [Streptomyces sp. TRM70350]
MARTGAVPLDVTWIAADVRLRVGRLEDARHGTASPHGSWCRPRIIMEILGHSQISIAMDA